MTLTRGTRIGSFEIVGLLGAGGMGEVYRALDPRLGREVAIKILPAAFTTDADRLERFEREARVLAAINHPNIGSIYHVEDYGNLRALVLELIEGETLAERLQARGALPVAEALEISRQIAEALDAAHEKGIIHRDLKPANIKISSEGVVKVLDFGLAKAVVGSGSDHPPHSTRADTREGVLLGTAAYMSPEQARGLPVDKRTDIWAFGCVFYEMLTGRAAFGAPTASDVIARILGGEADWAALPADSSPGVITGLKRCLEKDTKRRLRDLGDLDLALHAAANPSPVRASNWKLAGLIAGGAVLALPLALALTQFLRVAPADALPTRFELPVSTAQPSTFAVSPDGRQIVFLGIGPDRTPRLWLRSLDTLEERPISGTEGEVALNSTIFWSPDGRSIGFYADGRIKKVDIAGGVPQLVCTVRGVLVGGSWSRDHVIVMGNTAGGLLRCPAGGGEATAVTATRDLSTLHLFPTFLPDQRHVLYLHISRADPSENGLFIADVDSMPADQSVERLLGTGFGGTYVPTDERSGRILFARDQALYAVPFDPTRRVLTGEAVRIAAPIGSFRDGAFFSATANLLVYRENLPDVQLEWRSRTGSFVGKVGEPGPYAGFSLSPEATRIAILQENRVSRADQDVWLLDMTRDIKTRLTSDSQLESVPAWAANGQALMFAIGHGSGDVYEQPLNGTAASRLFRRTQQSEIRVNPLLTTMSASADGRFLVFTVEAASRAQSDLWIVSRANKIAAPLVQQDFNQTQGTISPDGRWLAYVSNESGVNEVFLRPLAYDGGSAMPKAGAPIPVSRGGATAPRWRGDSLELFYQSLSGSVMAAPVSTAGPANAVELFRAAGLSPHWAVTKTGDRFMVSLPVTQQMPPLKVVLNWQSPLGR